MNIGATELLLIALLALFLYGKRLPEITKALGKGYREFKNNFDGVKNDLTKQMIDIAKDAEIKDAQPDNPAKIKEANEIYGNSAVKEDRPSVKDNDNLAG